MSTTTVFKKQGLENIGCSGSCQYWNWGSFRCQIRREGLFIPLAQDMTAYCLSDNFTSCPRYQTLPTRHPGKLRLNSRSEVHRRSPAPGLQGIQQPRQAATP